MEHPGCAHQRMSGERQFGRRREDSTCRRVRGRIHEDRLGEAQISRNRLHQVTIQARQVENHAKMVSPLIAASKNPQYITVPHGNLRKHDTLAAAWTFSELIPCSPN